MSLRCVQLSSRGPRALSADTFEMLVDHFEKALHALLQQRVELCPALTDPASDPPDISGMYTLQCACDSEVSTSPSHSWPSRIP